MQNIPLRLPGEFMGQIDCIVVNDEEFVHSRDIVQAIGKSGYGVVTLGSGGAQVFTPDGMIVDPAFPLAVDDPTGAGDVFAAAFFFRMSERGVSTAEALRYANAAAGLSVAGGSPGRLLRSSDHRPHSGQPAAAGQTALRYASRYLRSRGARTAGRRTRVSSKARWWGVSGDRGRGGRG